MAAPKIRIKGMYLKPLVPPGAVENLDVKSALRRLKREILKQLRTHILQSTYSDAAKKALAKSIVVETKPSSLVIYSKHPAWKPLINGQKSEQMTWLTKARAPIPIITETGEMIFRTATAKSMKDGKWYHPGRESSDIVDKARKKTKELISGRLVKEFQKQIRKNMKKVR